MSGISTERGDRGERGGRLQTYDLYMHNDCFTAGHTQWFYFSVKNVKIGQTVVFNIRNFVKPDSLFNEGKSLGLLSIYAVYNRYFSVIIMT